MKPKFIHDKVATACFKNGTMWSVPLSNIALIGEYTTQDGPGADDHFFCIVDHNGNRYDIGDEDEASLFLDELAGALGEPLLPQLQFSTKFQSRILYPKSARGRMLFIDPCPPRTFISRLKWLFSSGNHRLQLSDDSTALIEHCIDQVRRRTK